MKNMLALVSCIIVIQFAHAQNVGIGTTQPQARLHITDSNVVFSATGSDAVGNPAEPPISGPGRRMMWYADKAAFRVGAAAGDQWTKDNIGNHSFAAGLSNLASGSGSTALGFQNTVSGTYSFAGGFANQITGMGSIALGYNNRVFNAYAVAMGGYSIAEGQSSFAAGSQCRATKNFSVAMGFQTKALGSGSFALGTNTTAEGEWSFVANKFTTAYSTNETVFGQYNTVYTPASTDEWVATDRLFVIGNGAGPSARSNAVTVFKNGNVGIMTAQPNARLSVNGDASKSGGGVWAAWSDARLKKNIVPYKSGLKEILEINPVRFQYNELSGEEDLTKNYVGIIAQEIEKILPSTISIKKDDKMEDKRMFDGSELTYTLINAIKELNKKLEAQELLIRELSQKIKNNRDEK